MIYARLPLIIAFLCITGPLAAQTTPPPRPATQPTTRPGARTAEEMLGQMLKPASEQPRPLQPIPDPGPQNRTDAATIHTVAPGATTRPLLPEGAFIIDRVARLTRHGVGMLPELLFDADGRTMADPPMIVLPNRALGDLERFVENSRTDPRLWVSGEVTQYNGRNYILLQRWSQVNDNAHPLR